MGRGGHYSYLVSSVVFGPKILLLEEVFRVLVGYRVWILLLQLRMWLSAAPRVVWYLLHVPRVQRLLESETS